ncbi:MAG TPA: two-component sensor histidine kinase, partial [Thermodesulfobacteriota bacterium]|nr:two-component sensor histidine kinase [Thermodesulfobacteriota bacterium]
VLIFFRSSGGAVELGIEDKGVGFDLSTTQPGLGLGSMRERVENTGGTFSIETGPMKGTVIWAMWPVDTGKTTS